MNGCLTATWGAYLLIRFRIQVDTRRIPRPLPYNHRFGCLGIWSPGLGEGPGFCLGWQSRVSCSHRSWVHRSLSSYLKIFVTHLDVICEDISYGTLWMPL
jgi:hypothetical protein